MSTHQDHKLGLLGPCWPAWCPQHRRRADGVGSIWGCRRDVGRGPLLPSLSCRLAGFTSLIAGVVVRECSPYPPGSGAVRGRWSSAAQPRTAWTHGSDNCRGRAPPGYPRPVEQQRYSGNQQRSPDRDQGDLPAGHAAVPPGKPFPGLMVMSVNRLPTWLGGGDAEVTRAAVTPTASAAMAPATSPARTGTDRWMRWIRFMTASLDTAAACCLLPAAT